jgi:transaldolase
VGVDRHQELRLFGCHVRRAADRALSAFADHGAVPGATAERDHVADLQALAGAGIDIDGVTAELLADGIRQFTDAMTSLLAGIERRRDAVV